MWHVHGGAGRSAEDEQFSTIFRSQGDLQKLLTHEEAQLSAQYYHHTQGSDLMANPYCSTAFKPWQLLCDISPCSCSISGIQWNRQWGFSVEPERLFRVAGQESVIPPELENGKFSLPSFLPPEECVLVKPHSLKDENNKNKPLLLLGWQKISRLWASSINRKKNSWPHMSYSLNAKKAVFKRQKQGRDFGGCLAKSESNGHCFKPF